MFYNIKYITICLAIYLLMDIWALSFFLGGIINKAAINIFEQSVLWTCGNISPDLYLGV